MFCGVSNKSFALGLLPCASCLVPFVITLPATLVASEANLLNLEIRCVGRFLSFADIKVLSGNQGSLQSSINHYTSQCFVVLTCLWSSKQNNKDKT